MGVSEVWKTVGLIGIKFWLYELNQNCPTACMVESWNKKDHFEERCRTESAEATRW